MRACSPVYARNVVVVIPGFLSVDSFMPWLGKEAPSFLLQQQMFHCVWVDKVQNNRGCSSGRSIAISLQWWQGERTGVHQRPLDTAGKDRPLLFGVCGDRRLTCTTICFPYRVTHLLSAFITLYSCMLLLRVAVVRDSWQRPVISWPSLLTPTKWLWHE